ncbi:MAG: HigA family addiction module antitoxin [Microcoleaceae cyanobacterium]
MKRPPSHPGEILLELYLKPLEKSQTDLAKDIGVPLNRVNEVIKGKRGVSPDTALRLAKYFGTSADVWLNLQQNHDLWHAYQKAREDQSLDTIVPVA